MPWPIDTYLNSASVNGDDEQRNKRNWENNVIKVEIQVKMPTKKNAAHHTKQLRPQSTCMKNKAQNHQTE